MPNLFVITGANGAGKSTLSQFLLPNEIAHLNVFDGDLFFVKSLQEIFPSQTKSPKYARDMAFKATVEEFEKLVSSAIEFNLSFAYEGHFSSESPWHIIRQFKEKGYHITMIFLMVEELAISLRRVTERVKTGGHYVTPQEIEKNFYGNIIQLDKHFTLLNDLIIADNSIQGITNQICYLSESKIINCIDTSFLPHWFIKHLPNISSIIK